MRFCPSCGNQNQDVANFCARCGTALAASPPPEHRDEPQPRAPEMLPRSGGGADAGYAPHGGPYPPQGGAYPPAGGHPQPYGRAYPLGGYQPPGPDMRGLDSGEQIGVFLGSLCVSPIVAVVLYFVWKDDKPQKAKEVCTLGWWVVGAWVGMYVVFFLIAILVGSSG